MQYYQMAKDFGAVPEAMIEDNIFETAEKDYQENQKTNLIEKYLNLYPNGKYAGQAKEMK